MDAETLKRRIAQELHEQFEGKLRESKRQNSELEEELEAASERWRAERRRLNTEIDRLESALADAKTTPKKPLKTKAGATDAADGSTDWASRVAAAEGRYAQASEEWNGERLKMRSEIQRLESTVAEILERSSNPVRSLQAVQQSLEEQLHDAVGARKRIEDELARARASWEEERLKLSGEVFRVRRGEAGEDPERSAELERALSELDNVRRELEEARAALKVDRPPTADTANSKPRQEMAQADLARELSRATAMLTEEQQISETASAELRRTREELQAARSELGRIQQQQESGGQGAEAFERAAAEYSARIEAMTQERAALAGKLESADALLTEERQRARIEIQRLERRLAEAEGAAAPPALDQLQAQFTSQLQELEEKNSGLAGRLESAGLLLEQERQRNAALNSDLSRVRTEAQQMERRLFENREAVSAEVVEQLRQQYGAKLQEIVQEKTALARELEGASTLLEQERQRFAAAADSAGAGGVDDPELEREVARVEEAIAEITRFIDDPAAQLAMVIRKNVERAELDAYLKGIHFTRGQRPVKVSR